MTQLPQLPTIKNGEVYMRLVEQAYNCRGNGIATDLTWYFQSIQKLGDGDIMIIGGNWVMQDLTAPAYIGNNYTLPIDLWKDAMKRGAKIALITSYYYTGNPDDCDNTATQALDHNDWGGTGISSCTNCGSPKYTTCHVSCCTIQHLKSNPNFIDLRNSAPFQGPTSHSKFISFQYRSRKEFGQFFGAWNPVIRYWPLKETGFGICGKLEEPLGIYITHWLYMFLEVVKNIVVLNDDKVNFTKVQHFIDLSIKVSNPKNVPNPPINVPVVYFYGPDYCDPNFGCSMTDQSGNLSRDSNTCQDQQKYVTLVDTNVKFTLGVAPSLLHHTPSCVGLGFDNWAKGWGGKGDKLMDALTLLLNFINGSKKFIKTAEMTQYLGIGTAADDSMDCSQDQVPRSIVTSLTKKMKDGIPYLAIEGGGDGDFGANGGNGCRMYSEPDLMAVAWRFACNQNTKGNFYVKSYGYGNTHDKFLVNENSLILSSGHPDTGFHLGRAYNYWLQIGDCPNLVTWMNNHWNSMWENCCYFPRNGKSDNQYLKNQIGNNPLYKDLGKARCPEGDTVKVGCCMIVTAIIAPKMPHLTGLGLPRLIHYRNRSPPSPKPPSHLHPNHPLHQDNPHGTVLGAHLLI